MVVGVTGHSGFIGRALCKAIQAKGWNLIKINREYSPIKCDRIYHLACPGTTEAINNDPLGVMDTIIDGTKKAIAISPGAEFINISSMGANDTTGDSPQICYNTAKRVMEMYLRYAEVDGVNYRLPSIYGKGMSKDSFIQRCIDGRAYKPMFPDKMHYIMPLDELIPALINLNQLTIEEISLGDIYDRFT